MPQRTLPVALVAVVLMLVAVSHGVWAWQDGRALWDQGLFYPGVQPAYRAFTGAVPVQEWLPVLLRPTGWYSALMGSWLVVFGRSTAALHALLMLQVLGLVGLTARLGFRVAGGRGAVVAAALTGAAPLVFAMGRSPWLHVTEALLALWALELVAPAQVGPWRRRAAVAVVALVLLLRPSGLVWAAPVGLWMLWGSRSNPRRVAAMAGVWCVAAIPVLIALPEYLSTKLDARERYAMTLPSVPEESLDMLGLAWLAVVGLGLVFRGIQRERLVPVEGVAAAWAGLALGLAWSSQSGLFNHTLLAPSLALIAAAGLSTSWARASLALPALLLAHGLSWVPAGPTLLGYGAWGQAATPWTWLRPYSVYGEAQAHALLDATCAGSGRCLVAADQGLFVPFSEEPGYFELFVTGRDEVELLPVRNWREGRMPTPQALAWWACEGAERAQGWQGRHPGTPQGLRALVEGLGLQPAWVVSAGEGCALVWHTPTGSVPRPEALPDGFAPGSAEGRAAIENLPGYAPPPKPAGEPPRP